MKYVYGPVPSRRLGRSLGVNVIPYKTCNYSCVYCQLGVTRRLVNERRSYFPKEDIIKEVASCDVEIDHITFAGEGEPTLCSDLGWLITKIKEIRDEPIAVLTNGSLLWREDVRRDLMEADVVIPSLDAGDEDTFKRLNRPHRDLKLERVVEGIASFCDEFEGRLYIEVMLVKGYNDNERALFGIKKALELIEPDGVYLMTPTRPTALKVMPADAEGVMRANAILGEVVKVLNPECGEFILKSYRSAEEALKSILPRHPMREEQVLEVLKAFGEDMDVLQRIGAKEVEYMGVKFYVLRP